jgi:hypothetical protein
MFIFVLMRRNTKKGNQFGCLFYKIEQGVNYFLEAADFPLAGAEEPFTGVAGVVFTG